MVVVYFGENIVLSRKDFLLELENSKKINLEIVQLDGKRLEFNNLKLCLESKSLFQDSKAIFIEDLFSQSKVKNEVLIDLLKANSQGQIFLWEGKDLTKTISDKLKQGFILKQYRLPQTIFKFVDSLRPGNIQNSLNLYRFCLEKEDPGMIFQMIIRQFRLLIMAKDGEKYLPGASWQKAKIISQAKLFKVEKLVDIYQRLLLIDYQQKTSQSAFNLSHSLDLLISEI